MIEQKWMAARPEDIGIDSERLEDVFARAKREVDDGIVPSAQVAVARHGRIAGLRTVGSAVQGGIEKAATDETLYTIFSCTKAVVAAAVWLLLEEGQLRLDERVAEIIPEFGTNGKDAITVEQVLLHAGGFPLAPYHPDGWNDRAKRLEAFAYWRLTYEPGTKFEYHATSAHWVLVEIIERRTGQDFREFIRERITGPIGLNELFVGLPPEYDERVADVCYTGEIIEPPDGFGEVTPEATLRFNQPDIRRAGCPGGGGIAGAGELALFYQTLVNGGQNAEGARILKPETIELARQVRTKGLVDRLGVPVLRGLSLVIAGDDGKSNLRGFGKVVSGSAFGHGGAGGQIGWGDPESGISIGYCTNGFTDYMTIGRRMTAISSTAADCAID
ncbi:MAG: serine hydrolase domain-containing protein [Dehalococcoidia bacterium]